MKKLSLFLALFIIASFVSSYAAPKISLDPNKSRSVYSPDLKPEVFGNVPSIIFNSKENSTQGAITKVGDVTDAAFTFYNKGTHLVYEPISGTLLFMYNNMKVSGTSISGGTIQLIYTQDLGGKWAAKNIYDGPDYQGYYNSFTVANTLKDKNVNGFQYLTTSWNYEKASNYSWKSKTLFNISGSSTTYSQLFDGPDKNNSVGTSGVKNYLWEGIDFTPSIDSKGNGYAFAVSKPFNRGGDNTLDVVKYAFMGWSFNDEDFTNSSLPTEWSQSQFSAPLGAGVGANPSGYSSPLNIKTDSEGNLYAALCNFYPDNAEARIPAVSKSTDKGKTWDKFDINKVPSTLIDAIAKAEWTTGNTDNVTSVVGGSRPYEGNGFIVTGKDEYTFLYRVYVTNTTKNEQKLLLIETSYKNKVWSANKISQLNGVPFILAYNTSTAFPNRYVLDTDDNGNEVELAITKDGQYIVAKYLDYNVKRGNIILNPAPMIIQDQGTQSAPKFVETPLDTLNTTDIMLAYKAVGSNSWNAPVYATNDLIYQKVTMMPAVVPSINQVPLMWLETNKITGTSTDAAKTYPDIALQMICDNRLDQSIQYLTADATADRTNVNDEKPAIAFGFSLNAVYPNPVTNEAEISFSLDNDGLTKLEVFSTVGQKVAVLVNDVISSGLHAVNFSSSSLTAGVYYYTLTVNGKSITKVLNVIK